MRAGDVAFVLMGSTEPAQRSPAGDASGEAGFDQVIARLRGVVERLEAGSLGLEQALAAFEEGVRLSRRGAEILDQAERRVEVLTRGEGGAIATAPFAPGEPGEDHGPA